MSNLNFENIPARSMANRPSREGSVLGIYLPDRDDLFQECFQEQLQRPQLPVIDAPPARYDLLSSAEEGENAGDPPFLSLNSEDKKTVSDSNQGNSSPTSAKAENSRPAADKKSDEEDCGHASDEAIASQAGKSDTNIDAGQAGGENKPSPGTPEGVREEAKEKHFSETCADTPGSALASPVHADAQKVEEAALSDPDSKAAAAMNQSEEKQNAKSKKRSGVQSGDKNGLSLPEDGVVASDASPAVARDGTAIDSEDVKGKNIFKKSEIDSKEKNAKRSSHAEKNHAASKNDSRQNAESWNSQGKSGIREVDQALTNQQAAKPEAGAKAVVQSEALTIAAEQLASAAEARSETRTETINTSFGASTDNRARSSSIAEKSQGSQSNGSASNPEGGESTQLDRVRFVQRVARAFQSMGERGGTIRLRLSPPELGSLRVEISVRHGTMSARLQAEKNATRNLLLDNLPALRERLEQQNIKIEHFQVDLMDQSTGGMSDQAFSQTPADGSARGNYPPRASVERIAEPLPVEGARAPVRAGEGTRLDVVV
jgi:flagellar hook-length control protein FliK